jgi:Carboxypeptidase regulatory-like domain/TonB dependent receptor/TonB-dependent Receptor Plug Domain
MRTKKHYENGHWRDACQAAENEMRRVDTGKESTVSRKYKRISLRGFSLYIILALCIIACLPALGQTGNATLGGIVADRTGAIVLNAYVRVTNIDTGVAQNAVTNGAGRFAVSGLNPGKYVVHISHAGFADEEIKDVTLNVSDKRELDVRLQVANRQETVTVDAGGATINTTDATVSTVIDRQFVNDIPMNGRSFQTLVMLAPGVVTSSPQGNALGEFSVNGMRTNSNNYMVDGVSASNSASFNSAAGSAGMAPSVTALGTTHSMLNVDALQEFRIATSTYSAEYGRQPGAQISFRSRSGTNSYHGTAFEYLRNSVFDANNWFNTYSTQPLPTPPERQHDFGGTLGGPLSLPHLYSGKDRAFFFFSYEGLRLDQPQPASIFYVPSNGTHNVATYANAQYKNIRAYAPGALQAALNAWPLPNCDTSINPQCVDYGTGMSPYLQTPPATGVIDSVNARVDYQLLPGTHLFARYGDATSSAVTYNTNGPDIASTVLRNRIYLLGADNSSGATFTNELRLQYSPSYYDKPEVPSQANGGQSFNFNTAQGLAPVGGETWMEFLIPNKSIIYQQSYGSQQFQPNASDTVTWIRGRHLFKAGVDYRQTTAYYGDGALSRGPYATYQFTSASQILANKPKAVTATNYLRSDPTTKNLGLFVQDEWRMLPNLSLSLGLRWDLYPPPSVSGAQMFTYTGDLNSPSSLGLSPQGASLYQTTYTNFAPRIGVAWVISNQRGRELVLRVGGGLFYDGISISQTFGAGYGLGSAVTSTYSGKPQGVFPLTAADILIPVAIPPTAPYSFTYYPDPHIVPPSALQWSASMEQALGGKQSFSLGYVASTGHKLSTLKEYSLSKLNPQFGTIDQYENGPGSSYNSMQLQYRRQALRGLQVIASYTWSHAIDWASTDYYSADMPLQHGNSDNDVRHNFTAALVYNLPSDYSSRWERIILGRWNADLWMVARSAFPYEPSGAAITDPATGNITYGRLNYNGQPPYVSVHGIPGGRQINPAVFRVPMTGQVGTAPRNFLRGFGENQENIAIQRSFPIYERTQLQFRAEAFNIINHPTFGSVNTTCGATVAGTACNNVLMGQATSTLSSSLSGLSSLYQQGGPRSLQFMLKLQF